MKEKIPLTDLRKFVRGLWIGVTVMFVVAVFFFYPGFNSDEGVYRIDQETMAMRYALDLYRKEFGAFPQGDTRAILAALHGKNPKGEPFIRLRLTEPGGDWLDPWGTPYKIYFSDDWPLVRSAGPNKQFDSSTQRRKSDDYFGG